MHSVRRGGGVAFILTAPSYVLRQLHENNTADDSLRRFLLWKREKRPSVRFIPKASCLCHCTALLASVINWKEKYTCADVQSLCASRTLNFFNNVNGDSYLSVWLEENPNKKIYLTCLYNTYVVRWNFLQLFFLSLQRIAKFYFIVFHWYWIIAFSKSSE